MKRVLLGLLVANLGVVGAKFVIGLRSGSLGVLGDAVHSSVDAMNNVVALVVIWVAAREPDEDHPYGHEKFETLGALAIVGFLSITGFELVKNAISRLSAGGAPLEISVGEITILAGTLLVNTAVTVYETRRGRQLNSPILLADAAHTRADVFITIGVIAGVIAGRAGYGIVDPIVALAVSGIIVYLAYTIVAGSIPALVDRYAVPPDRIRDAAQTVAGVVRAYDVRSRGVQDRLFAELTISIDGSTSVEAGHVVADAVEHQLRDDLGFHEVIVHVEPC
ncbi:MAG: cation transporter [Gemmatimonadales bacterium]|nr:cation transporter [Gemmatimonadales bacterium]